MASDEAPGTPGALYGDMDKKARKQALEDFRRNRTAADMRPTLFGVFGPGGNAADSYDRFPEPC
ncbi:MAG: hypothetical protein LBH70_01210 [Spirochaetaceae bacterium]|nr:hypothetical protein [Spirochaetaceae bacterium]